MSNIHPLRIWRVSKKMNQAALADQLGIGPSQVSQIENGQKGCSLDVAIKIQELTKGAVPLKSLLPTAEAAA